MAIPTDKLEEAGVNVAAVIHEEFLNNFAAAHKAHNPSVYTGSTLISELDDLVKIDYEFADPVTFDLNPIQEVRFKKIWKNHLLIKGGDPERIGGEGITPGNVALKANSVIFTVTVYEGQDTSKIKFSVQFDWALRARAAISLKDEGGGKRAIVMEPIKVAFEAPKRLIEKEIKESLALLRKDGAALANVPDQSFSIEDEDWCLKVEKLVLLFLNGILSTQISNFIREWELPRAIELVDGAELQPDYLLISNNQLIVGGQITTTPLDSSPLQSEIDSLINQFNDRYLLEFEGMSDQELENWSLEDSPTAQWLEGIKTSFVNEAHMELAAEVGADIISSPTVQIISDDALIDILAKKFLSVKKGWEGEAKLDRVVKGVVGWWFTVDGAEGKIIPRGIQLSANVNIGGKAQVCHFDFDPKNFGGWKCHGPCVNLSPDPDFRINGFPTFHNSGVYLNARLMTRGIAITFCNWPSWANRILAWATSMLTQPLLDAIRAIIALFRIRIVKYPKHFPGTGLEWRPNMLTAPSNEGRYLVFGGSPIFV